MPGFESRDAAQYEEVMAKFAEGTEVPTERSKAEIERILTRFGADQFGYGWMDEAAVVFFRAQGRHIRFKLPMPSAEEAKSPRSRSAKEIAREREVRRRWRALCLCIKAKLTGVETGIETFEESFMAHMVMPNGQTMSEHAKPLIARAYEDGKMPALLPHLT